MVELLQPNLAARFQNLLPIPTRIETSGAGVLTIEMQQVQQWLGLRDGNGNPLLTTIWGYGLQGQTATYPGPTLLAHENVPVQVRWSNKLPNSGFFLPVDASLHYATPDDPTIAEGAVPTVVHLHGGHTSPESDGHPEAWFTQNFGQTGEDFVNQVYTYENDQQAASLWYHDHTLGLTRLTVYAGLAGFYLIDDVNRQQLRNTGVLPSGSFDVEATIQDRSFKADGQLYRPAFADDPIPGLGVPLSAYFPPDYSGPYPTTYEEAFFDHILVNGMAWPKFDAEPGQYLFRLLNGSDSRFYLLKLDNPNVKVTMVGNDGGLLPNAVTIMDGDGVQELGESIVFAPGKRLELVFDFSNVAGESVTLLNAGNRYQAFKGLEPDETLILDTPATPNMSIGAVMRFDVADHAPLTNATVTDGTVLNPTYEPIDPDSAVKVRRLGLFQQAGNGKDHFGRDKMFLGVEEPTLDKDGNLIATSTRLHWHDPTTEMPQIGTTEIWEIFNETPDAHPVHLHLVQFQVLEKRVLGNVKGPDGNNIHDNGDGIRSVGIEGRDDMFMTDEIVPPRPEETGWQDTAWVEHGQMIRILVTFDRLGEYVWHCHLLPHEDHDMMRPFEVVDAWAGYNVVDGTTGGDTVQGAVGNDVLNGYGGDDVLIGGGGADILNGALGSDTASYQSAFSKVTANLADQAQNTGEAAGDDYGNNIENLTGSGFNDILIGDRGINILSGGAGHDVIQGLRQNDSIDGGSGSDMASYVSYRSEYDVRTASVGGALVTSINHVGGNQGEGFDTVVRVEYLKFRDQAGVQVGVLAGGQLNRMSSADGDRFDDALFRHATTGQTIYARMVNGDFADWQVATSSTGPGWGNTATGDLNPSISGGSGAETFVQEHATGTIYYASHDTGALTWGLVTAGLTSHYILRTVADLNGDASVDAVVQNDTDGAIYYADVENDGTPSWGLVSNTIDSTWIAVGAGDINGDGFADVIVQQQGTGTTYFAKMANGAFSGWGVVSANLTADWQVKAVADVTGDGYADVIFQNRSGQGGVAPGTTYFADMAQGAFKRWGVVSATVGADWVAAGTADVDNDGYAEVLFQNEPNGTTYYAAMGANGFEGFGFVAGPIGSQWDLI